MRLITTFITDPIGVVRALPGEFRQRIQWRHGDDQGLISRVDEAWDEHLHGLLGAPWPCPAEQQLDEVMADIDVLLAASGLKSGRFTYGWYSDAESLLCHAVWCVALHTRPEVVVETGVAHGVTSRVVLEALKQNESGHLWSIDLPFPFDHRLHGQTGVVVPDACRSRWSYLEGASSQRLPPLVDDVGHVEMFIHDSLHTAKNTLFEMDQAASVMPSGGVMLVDDIGSHDGFTTFARQHPQYQTIICPSADRAGIFGIAVKTGSAAVPG
jgi:Methyltransferase domain